MSDQPPPPMSVKRAARLGAKKHREAERLFLAEGEALIREATEPPRHVFDAPDQIKRISSLKTPADLVGVFPFVDVSPDRLLSGASLGGVVSEGVEESGKTNTAPSRQSIVFLHGVQDPGNVGTVIRSAHAFGASVVLSEGCADLYNSKTVRGTMGAIFHVPISREAGTMEFLKAASGHGFTSVAAMPEEGRTSRSLPEGRLVIVVGAEGSGLSEEAIRACDERVTIPSRAASLNAAVAASILLYEAHMRVLP